MFKKKYVPTELDLLKEEYYEALAEQKRIETNYNNASAEFFDAANAELTAAKAKVNCLIKKIKINMAG